MVALTSAPAPYRKTPASPPLEERLLLRYARRRCRRSFAGFRPARGRPVPTQDPLHLYLHVPFCEQLCPYCSFHRVRFEDSMARAYFCALREEMRHYARRGFRFDSLSVGGGTPTVAPAELAETLELSRSLWHPRHLTVETNPSHLTTETMHLLRAAGVDRLSVGVQSFHDEVLTALGRSRYGSSTEIRRLLPRAAGAFPTLNVDLIFGFPGQSADMAAADARAVRELGIPQVTFYPLMHSPRTRAALRRRMGRTDCAPLQELYGAIRDALGPAYEASSAWCFSRSSGLTIDEYIVEHEQYAGLGAGAFGLVDGTLWATTFSLPRYVEAIRDGRPPFILTRRYSRFEQWEQRMLMSLFGGRLRPAALGSVGGPGSMVPLIAALGLLGGAGALRYDRRELRTTRRGQYLAALLMKEFFQAVNDFRDACRTASGEEGDP